MRDYAFYNADCGEPGLLGSVLKPFRRLLRRILRPFFVRQVELMEQLGAELQELTHRQEQLEAMICDQEALARRLAALEEHVESLLRREEKPATIPLRSQSA